MSDSHFSDIIIDKIIMEDTCVSAPHKNTTCAAVLQSGL